MQLRQIHSGKFTMRKGGMKDVVRLVAVILVCQLPPDPKTETEPARDFGRKHQRINRSHKEIFKLSVNITWVTNKATSTQSNALCVLCSVGSSVLKNALYLIQSDRLSLSIIYRAIHFDQWDSSVSTTVSNSELSDCSVSTTELSDRSCIWYWVAFGRKFQF